MLRIAGCVVALLWMPFLPTTFVAQAVAQADLAAAGNPQRPNILWITSEDNGPQLGCYGDTIAHTPNLDRLATRGQIYLHAWSNAPVCAPARTAIITGMYPTSLGAQNMRSHVRLPKEFLLLPQYFQQHGYYTSNNAKEDYNVIKPKDAWDASSPNAHWRKRAPGQPFFSVFNFATTHESEIRKRPHVAVHDPLSIALPPYHPDLPEVRQDWAQYYDQLNVMDDQVGQVLAQLRQDKLDDNTIVFYFGDHGSGMPRGKRWLYQGGLHVPMIVYAPPRYEKLVGPLYQAGGQSQRLVSFVDLAPTMLSLLGTRPPEHMQGSAFLGDHATPAPEYLYGFRDRMDERYDMSRAIRDEHYLYIRNYFPQRPQGTYLNYMFQMPTTQKWKEEFDAGRLNAAQAFFWQPKPAEELYDLQADPFQIENLVESATLSTTLDRLRGGLRAWMAHVRDTALLPEGELLARAGDESPYTYTHDSAEKFPVDALLDAADLATGVHEGDFEKLLANRSHSESGVRFWTANGFLIRAADDRQRAECVDAARSMLVDPSAYVRCLSNETLARFGNERDRLPALHGLLELANADRHNMFEAMMALNSLDWTSPEQSEIGDRLIGLPRSDKRIPERYQTSLPRLIERVQSIVQP